MIDDPIAVRLDVGIIGRDRERERLGEAIVSARAGTPTTSVVAGEPGVGKSSLMHLALDAVEDASVFVARCPQRITAPYFVFGELLWAITESLPEASDLVARGRILDDQLRGSARSDSPDSGDAERAELFHSVTRYLTEVASGRFTVIVIDDLQWIDQTSAELFDYVIGAFHTSRRGLPVAFVMTRRDTGVDVELERLIESIERNATETIDLSPLGVDAVDEYLRRAGIEQPAPSFVTTLHDATRGNPLHLREALRQLSQAGALTRRGGRVHAELRAQELRPPRGLVEVFEQRIEATGPGVREFLELLAIAGHRVTAQRAGELMDDDPAAAVADAIESGLVVERNGLPRFEHDLVRTAVLDLMEPRRQRELHCLVGMAMLEGRVDGDDAPHLEIAHHLLEGDAERDGEVLRALVRAGRAARKVWEWRLAQRFLQPVLDTLSSATGDRVALSVEAEGWLHYWMGRCCAATGDVDAAVEHHRRAVAVAKGIGALELEARATCYLIADQSISGSVAMDSTVSLAPIEDLIERARSSRPGLLARLSDRAAQTAVANFDIEAAEPHARAALAAALTNDDREFVFRARISLGMIELYQGRGQAAVDTLEAALAEIDEGAHRYWLAYTYARLAAAQLQLGRVDDADASTTRAIEAFEEVRDVNGVSMSTSIAARCAIARGDIATAMRHSVRVGEMLGRSSYFLTPYMHYATLWEIHSLLGEWDRCAEVLDEWRASGHPGSSLPRMQLEVRRGDTTPDRVDELIGRCASGAGGLTITTIGMAGALASTSLMVGADVDTSTLRSELDRFGDEGRDAIMSPLQSMLLPEVRGLLDELDGDFARAATFFAEGSRVARDLGLAAEEVECLLAEARVRIAHRRASGETPLADVHAESALQTAFDKATRLGLRCLQDDAQALASDAGVVLHGAVDEPVALLLTDIVSSTEFVTSMGNQRWVQLIDEHDRLTESCVRSFGGEIFAHTGDGMMALVRDPDDAMECAGQLLAAIDRFGIEGLSIRVGMTYGLPVKHRVKLHGVCINQLARIGDIPDAGEVVISQELADVIDDRWELESIGDHALKGFPEPASLYRARVDSAG